MRSTSTKIYRDNSLGKSVCSFLLLVAIGVGLITVQIKANEKIKSPEEVKSVCADKRGDVLSAADSRQWRQEFLWHRTIRKSCVNPWIDDEHCARIIQEL